MSGLVAIVVIVSMTTLHTHNGAVQFSAESAHVPGLFYRIRRPQADPPQRTPRIRSADWTGKDPLGPDLRLVGRERSQEIGHQTAGQDGQTEPTHRNGLEAGFQNLAS